MKIHFVGLNMQEDKAETISNIDLPESLISKSKYNGEKRRLIFHAGTSKTGTTTLQFYLGENRKKLEEFGYWFPAPFEDKRERKHQQLIHALLHPHTDEFANKFEALLQLPPESCHTIILSAEGFHNHWYDFSLANKAAFAEITSLFDLEIWMWFKHPLKYSISFYIQTLKNPRMKSNREKESGQDVDFASFLEAPWFDNLLNTRLFVEQVETLFGENTIKAFIAEGDIINQFEEAIGESFGFDRAPNLNVSPSQTGIDLLRVINRLDLAWHEKMKICDDVLALDQTLNHKTTPFKLSPEDEKRVVAKAESQWAYIQNLVKRPNK